MKRTRKLFNSLPACLLVVAALAQTTSIQADDAAFLVQGGDSTYRILLREDASPSEKLAASELRQYFGKCTGVALPVVNQPPT